MQDLLRSLPAMMKFSPNSGETGLTRLYYDIIKDIPQSLPELDSHLLRSTGHNLIGLAARTIGVSLDEIINKIHNCSAAVVPISSGLGVIRGFAEAVEAVLLHLGMRAWITRQTDVAGLGEAFRNGADILFASDDREFLAIDIHSAKVVNNTRATAYGFVNALSAAAEITGLGLKGRDVLVLGLGPVGMFTVEALESREACISVCDTDPVRLQACADAHRGVNIAPHMEKALQTIDFVVDATPSAGIIHETMIRPSTVISCPGVPHGLTPAALLKIGDRFIHDNLALGVAVMAVDVCMG